MSTLIQISENIEPITTTPEVVESIEDRTRRVWSESGADYAYFVVRFLQGRRKLPIQPSEIVKTQLYRMSDEIERKALRLVCEVSHEIPPSPEDERHLQVIDQFLIDHLAGRTLGHADVLNQLKLIPVRVAERKRFDATLFATVWESPKGMFSWLWRARV